MAACIHAFKALISIQSDLSAAACHRTPVRETKDVQWYITLYKRCWVFCCCATAQVIWLMAAEDSALLLKSYNASQVTHTTMWQQQKNAAVHQPARWWRGIFTWGIFKVSTRVEFRGLHCPPLCHWIPLPLTAGTSQQRGRSESLHQQHLGIYPLKYVFC